MTEGAFEGRIVILRHPAWQRLAERAARIVTQHLPGEPMTAHQRMGRGVYLEAVARIRDDVKADRHIRAHFREGLTAAGLDPTGTFRDRLILRAQPPSGVHAARETAHLPAHRDNWGSGIAQQLNWWMPVFPVEQDRTLWLFPALFREPVANDSRAWNFDEVLAQTKAGLVELTTPKADAAPDPELAEPLLLEPGEMAVFSGSQLHQSAPNAGPLARFNFETRTVSLDHIDRRLGAPNVDGAPQGPHWRWFRHVDTSERMDRVMSGSGLGL
ncbi:MAG: hypothetical protein ACMVY4_09245 [Minwuia sp.]|uniref:hypothetical protein n=1 Tax=Minwuia sp. TaxID=2493630 RepID=UPI003A8AA7E4